MSIPTGGEPATDNSLDLRDGRPAYLVARHVLVAFCFTFMASRILVLLIMTHRMPNLYFHAGGTHVHHLNYGIFLLSAVGAYLLFRRPRGRRLTLATLAYGVGLGLTFDEFGMWLHLGGPYWQRASFDAVIVIFSLLGLLACAPEIKRIRSQHFLVGLGLIVILGAFAALVVQVRHSTRWNSIAPMLQRIEENAPE